MEPGEKLYEELLTPKEGVTATKHQRIFVAQLEEIEEHQLLSQIDELSLLADGLDAEGDCRQIPRIGADVSAEPRIPYRDRDR